MLISYLDKKILPVTYPIITSYPPHAVMFSIFSDNEEDLIWFYTYYLQLSMSKNENSKLDFNINSFIFSHILKVCPLLEYHAISCSFINKNFKNIIDFIFNAINEGYYIFLDIDEYEIPAYKRVYKRYHVEHSLMLYGYDKNTKSFNIADFFNERYEFATATFDEVNQGYINFSYSYAVILLKKTHKTQTNLHIGKIKNIINDYLSSTNTAYLINYDFYSKEYLYGVEIYSLLKECIENERVDIKDFHLLSDHKTVLLGLVNQLNKENYLKNYKYFYNGFSEIRKKALILRNILIKSLVKQMKVPDKLILLLDQIASSEVILLRELLEEICDNKINNYSNRISNIEFVCRDEVTKGNWKQTYGKLGYDIIGDIRKVSDFIHLQYFNAYNRIYPELCSKDKALQSVDSDLERIFAIRSDLNKKGFILDIRIDVENPINLSLYFMGLDNSDWKSYIDIFDSSNNKLLHHVDVTDITNGVYLKFRVIGNIKLYFYNEKNNDTFLSGVFFD